MGWPKGKKRGPSSRRGRKLLDFDFEWMETVFADTGSPPEERFVAVMDSLLESMANSGSADVARAGTRLRAFWDGDMARTIIWTPEVVDVPGEERSE